MITKTYDCGMRLICEQDKSIQAVAVKIYCLVGGNNEDDSNRGIAHLAEHMFFKGTEHRTSKEINSTFDKLGIIINAFTDLDRTCYHTEGLTEYIETMFDVMSDCLYNSTYPKEELDKEKTVVCSELEMYDNDFERVAETNGQIISLQGTGYDHVLGGTVESVSKLETADLINFRNKWYTPDRIVVSVCGDVDFDTVDALVKKYLIKDNFKKATPVTFHKPCLDIDIKKRYLFQSKETDQVYGMLNFRAINKSSEDVTAFNLARLALGSTTTSRLFTKLREMYGLVYVITTYPSLYGDFGINSVYFIASAKNSNRVLALIKETIDEVLKDGFTQEELDTYKNISKSSLILSNQSIATRAAKIAESIIYTEKEHNIQDKIAEINAVTLEQMNEAFKKYFDYQYLTVALVAKEDNFESLKLFGI